MKYCRKAVFVTGTDTGVGKSVVTGILARSFVEEGIKVITQKWVQTGCNGFPQDIATHMRFAGIRKEDVIEYLDYIAPYIFGFPSSPHLAAKLENRKISSEKIIRSFHFLKDRFDFVIVEGSGGILVPYGESRFIIDIVKRLNLPVIIVVNNILGCINHTLLTIDVARNRGLHILGIVFNMTQRTNAVITADNKEIIRRISKVRVLGEIPYSKNIAFSS